MRLIEPTTAFKRDYKKILAMPRHRDIVRLLPGILELLATDAPLLRRHHDHPLAGEWKDHRDCHIKPDLVLIYRKSAPGVLQLVRLGSHSELGL